MCHEDVFVSSSKVLVPICLECAQVHKVVTADMARIKMQEWLHAQCFGALWKKSSQIEVPSWTDILARIDPQDVPRYQEDGLTLAHGCVLAKRPDVLRLVLSKWPGSVDMRDHVNHFCP
jgi:hypothetical protein